MLTTREKFLAHYLSVSIICAIGGYTADRADKLAEALREARCRGLSDKEISEMLESLEEEFAAYLNESKAETSTNEDLVFNKIKQEEGSFEDVSEEMIKNED